MSQMNYYKKCIEIADNLGCQILIEDNDVYLQSDDIKSHFLKLPSNGSQWDRIYHELLKWGEGCNLIAPVKIS